MLDPRSWIVALVLFVTAGTAAHAQDEVQLFAPPKDTISASDENVLFGPPNKPGRGQADSKTGESLELVEFPKLLQVTEIADENIAEGEIPAWSFEELQKVFAGDLSLIVPKPLPEPLPIMMRRGARIVDGTPRPIFETRYWKWDDVEVTPELAHAVAVAMVEKTIADMKKHRAGTDAAEETLIRTLRFLYRLRFDLDTAFQDFKVTEIEKRATKLRSEVDRRAAATEKWVDAMMTFEQMEADGIEGVRMFQPSLPEPAGSPRIYPTPYGPAIPLPSPAVSLPSRGGANPQVMPPVPAAGYLPQVSY